MDEELSNLLGPGFDLKRFEARMVRQSQIFYADLLPVLYQCCLAFRKQVLTLCDIGANSGAGAALLTDVLNNLTTIRVQTHCFDLDPRYQRYARAKFPQVSFEATDFAAHPEPFDIAICSHTLEHVPEPVTSVRKILSKVTGAAIFYTPFEEKDLHPEHVNRFDAATLATLPGIVWARQFKSAVWRPVTDSRVVIFVCLPETRRADAALVKALRAALDEETSAGVLDI